MAAIERQRQNVASNIPTLKVYV